MAFCIREFARCCPAYPAREEQNKLITAQQNKLNKLLGGRMSTVNDNTQGFPAFLKAGNTVETLTPKPVGASYDLPSSEDLDAIAAEEAIKEQTSGQDQAEEAFFSTEDEEWLNQPVTQIEFAEYHDNVIAPLIEVLEDLAARIVKYNVGSPHKI